MFATSSLDPIGDPSIPVRQGRNVVSQHYTVHKGDTLSGIALKFYGDKSLFPLLAVVNHIPNPNVIHTGDVLLIPDLADTFASNDSSVPAVTARNYADGDGVLGDAIGGGQGLAGHSHTGIGVFGESDTFEGVRGVSHSKDHGAVVAVNDSLAGGDALYGESTAGEGVRGVSHSKDHGGVVGTNDTPDEDGDGVFGQSDSVNCRGVHGVSRDGYGVWGDGGRTGLVGMSTSGDGIFGQGKNTGVTGFHGDPHLQETSLPSAKAGVFGASEDGAGVMGYSRSGLAGEFFGDVRVERNLEVDGDIFLPGADCAEQFDTAGTETIEAGSVVVIDQAGLLRQSQLAYDRKVAGVVSGAGAYRPGIVLDNRPPQDARLPVALVGKVFCRVDAEYAPVGVGDLLTSSPTPGHAMKAEDPAKAFGAVIGKALGNLLTGKGLLPILVALQ
jgi:LysM repeat protein